MGYKQGKWLIGVDEAGRGPLAGPVAVGVVKVPDRFDWTLLSGVGDSKKVTSKKRAEIFQRTQELKKEGRLDFVVTMGSAKEIDEKGITVVVRHCIEKGMKELKLNPAECMVKLDGTLRGPSEFRQDTIIKGDSKELVIGLASICAKETRDEYMQKIAKRFSAYGFEVHKGYGTKRHCDLIREHGLSELHRVTYCQKLFRDVK
jgi:ribonuclease HII